MRAPSGAAHGRGPGAATKPIGRSPLITAKLPERKLYSARTSVHKSADGAAHTAGIRRDLEKINPDRTIRRSTAFSWTVRSPRPAHTPTSDPTGENYTFEKGVNKTSGGQGFADVWMRGHFAWEYKGKHKDLNAAYRNSSNTVKTWKIRPCLSSVTLTDSRSTRTSLARPSGSTISRLHDLMPNQATAACRLPAARGAACDVHRPEPAAAGQTTAAGNRSSRCPVFRPR